ncbi:MAG: D-tyrosyl-tRNA(Tyr) deacylase [Gammaproteobacteria bacterium]|nr:MAG: D-tyrosyl-tRNA(Tyr) deacylase [Gammaproteobacteria bacterium]
MIALVQRVNHAAVTVNGQQIARIGKGMLVFIGIEKGDDMSQVVSLSEKLRKFRIFPDKQGKMNDNVEQFGGEILLVPQFTLAAETKKGNRPGFDPVADPQTANYLFDELINYFRQKTTAGIATGIFQADMKVSLENDGPVTFWLQK